MKSRTIVPRTVSRTYARVKSRISSIGSLVSTTTESPNPLLAPPSPLTSQTMTGTKPTLVLLNSNNPPSKLDGADGSPRSNLPPSPSFQSRQSPGLYSTLTQKYHATAYVKFDISCISHIKGVPVPSEFPLLTNSGHLFSLSLDLSLAGPAVTLSHYGNLNLPSLEPGEHWVNLVHIGIKDTSLASKLSTSLRSLGRSAGKSAGRLERYANIDLINRWLRVLESDDDTNTSVREPVIVHATIKYHHSLLTESTTCMDKVSCNVKMTKTEIERAEMTDVELQGGLNKKGAGSDKDANDTGSDDEYEERLREARVLGAPWL